MLKKGRLTKGSEYKNTVRLGNRVGTEYFVTYAVFVSRETFPRFGYIITKTVGNAVTRNKIRRRLKSISLELLQENIPGCNIVIRVFPKASKLDYQELRTAVRKAIHRQIKIVTE